MVPKLSTQICVLLVIVIFQISDSGTFAMRRIDLQSQSLLGVPVNRTHRTGYHFQPPRNWMNDPNGPLYYNGMYHFFYQYNPKGAKWGNIVWAHSVSKDLVNWQALPPAIYPTKHFDINGCWSGSATILPGKGPIILYTGLDTQQRQVQNYAIPANASDPYLRYWIKPDNNPLIVPTPGINATEFHDPTTAWFEGGHWNILIGSIRKNRGLAYLYRSRDFINWIKTKHPLHSAPNTGMWECPDFFPVLKNSTKGVDTSVLGENVKHVMKVSLDETRYEYYTVGTYHPYEGSRYVPDNTSDDGWSGLRYDYGNFYASKSFFDPVEERRVLWAWANESDHVSKGWAGIQTIPRKIWLDINGKQLLQWPVREIETLRGQKVHMSGVQLKNGEHIEIKGITAAQADVDMVFSFSSLEGAERFNSSWLNAQDLCGQKGSEVPGTIGPFGILALASEHLEEFTAVFFRIFKAEDQRKHRVLMCSDARRSSLEARIYKPSFAGFVDVELNGGRISLRSLTDHSVVESFGAGGKTCITSRVYPTLAVFDKAHLFAFNNGTRTIMIETLDAWSMNRAIIT